MCYCGIYKCLKNKIKNTMIIFSFSDTTPSKFKFSGDMRNKETTEGKVKDNTNKKKMI